VTAAREDMFGDKGSSDFWILMRAWITHRRIIQDRGASQLASRRHSEAGCPLHEQFLRIAETKIRTGRNGRASRCEEEALQKCILIGFRIGSAVDQGTLRCELVRRRGMLREKAVVRGSLLFRAEYVRLAAVRAK